MSENANVRENLEGRNCESTSSMSMQWPPNVNTMLEKPWKKASRPSGGCVAAWGWRPCAQLEPIMYQLGGGGRVGVGLGLDGCRGGRRVEGRETHRQLDHDRGLTGGRRLLQLERPPRLTWCTWCPPAPGS